MKACKDDTHTSSPTAANTPIIGILRVSSNVPDLRVQKSLALAKLLTEKMFDAPEAARGDGCPLCIFGKAPCGEGLALIEAQ